MLWDFTRDDTQAANAEAALIVVEKGIIGLILVCNTFYESSSDMCYHCPLYIFITAASCHAARRTGGTSSIKAIRKKTSSLQ